MKVNTKLLLFSGLVALFATGCSSFLEEYSQDERVPASLKDFEEILYGEAYFKNDHLPYEYLEYLTDDVTSMYNAKNTGGDDTRQDYFGYYAWQPIPEVTPQGGLKNDLSWEQLYHRILIANVLLEKLPSISGAPEEKASLEGEAYAIRANSYFLLINLYAEPYTSREEAMKTPGVPINSHTYGEDTNFPRATVAEVYDQITNDLTRGLEAFRKSKGEKNIFRWNEAALLTLSSRVYLYLRDWDKAARYAALSIEKNPYLRDLNVLETEDPKHEKAFLSKDNREINFSYGFYMPQALSSGHLYYLKPSDDLTSQFEKSDLRYTGTTGRYIKSVRVRIGGGIFNPIYGYFTTVGKNGSSDDTGVYGYAIRSAEAYLNRAEALAMKGDKSGAIADLNALRVVRHRKGTLLLAEPATSEEVIRLVREERRRELCFEFQRWFDLRRWGKPALHHDYITNGADDTRTEYKLEASSPRYTLPIPQAVLSSDASLGKN